MDIVDEMSPEDKSNVARGLKSTLSNPNTSEEAKKSAQERLDAMGDTSIPANNADKDPSRVAGGLKAAISNPGISEEGKKEAQRKLDEMGAK